ncbi:MAG: HAD family hydrolase [Treponema sp.]|nr:HAD family hydrolase [Treponema sp.]
MIFGSLNYRCIIFDCDGTLVDTIGDIAAAANQALIQHGFQPVPVEKYLDMVGWGLTRLVTLALPEEARTDEVIREVAASALKFMEEQTENNYLSKPYPGIREMVKEFSQNNKIATAVLSNKPDSVLHRLMNHLFWPNAFNAVCGLRPGMAPKPDPQSVWEILAELGKNPHDTIFMGDSEIDMETALNAGCYPLGVSWGFRSRATLEQSGAASIIDRPDEVWNLVSVTKNA